MGIYKILISNGGIEMENMDSINQFIKSNKLCLIAVSKNTCNVCFPVISKVEAILKELPTVPYTKVVLDDVPEFSGKFLVFSAPTILLFFKGNEVLRQSGFLNFHQLKKDIELWVENFSSLDRDPFTALYD